MAAEGSANGCCRVLWWILGIIVTIIVLIGLAIALFFIIVNPQKMKVHVTEASLAEFEFSEANKTLRLNLDFTFSIRNPNRIMGFYYDDFVTSASYDQDTYLTYVHSWSPKFYQGRKNTTVLAFKFEGKKDLYFSNETDANGQFSMSRFKARFDEDKKDGVADFEVRVGLFIVRVKLGSIKIGNFQPKIRCFFGVPLVNTTGKGKSAAATRFNSTKCDVEFKVQSILY